MDQILQELGGRTGFSNVLLIWALLMGRLMPLVIFAPFIGGDVVPSQVKLGVGLTLSMLLYPFVSETVIPASAVVFMVLLLKEVFIGLIIATAATFAFDAARSAGTLVDTISGANQAQLFVPQLQTQVSIVADLKFQIAVVLFLGLNGHHVVIQAICESFRAIPINTMPKFSHGFWPVFEMVIRMSGDIVIVAVALAAPSALAAFMTDMTMGLINRAAPQIQVFFISMAIKPLVVTVMLLSALFVVYDRLRSIFHIMLQRISETVQLFS